MTDEISAQIDLLSAQLALPDAPRASLLYRRGALYWKLGLRAKALTDFNESARLDPSGPGAAAALHFSGIMDFFNPQNP